VPVDLSKLIKKVWLAPLAATSLEAQPKGITQRYGLHLEVSRSMLEQPKPIPDSPIEDLTCYRGAGQGKFAAGHDVIASRYQIRSRNTSVELPAFKLFDEQARVMSGSRNPRSESCYVALGS
jgi:hypothetical protein